MSAAARPLRGSALYRHRYWSYSLRDFVQCLDHIVTCDDADRDTILEHPHRQVFAEDGSGGFAAVNYRHDGDQGLTLSLPNGLVLRGISADNVPVVRQLFDQL